REHIFNLTLENPEVKGLHELKTRRSGLTTFIQMHIEVDPDISLKKAHAIADEVEATVGEAFPGAEIIIHTDPLGLEREAVSERELPKPARK
ncbi:MAG TPA: cation transporter dimerization domain-containing protein, partial [Sphingomonadales bacterium]|nr:cation transporter dimerization domain-containing protein [Sphingomonadales bacterium]